MDSCLMVPEWAELKSGYWSPDVIGEVQLKMSSHVTEIVVVDLLTVLLLKETRI